MKRKQMKDLRVVTEIAYQREQQKLGPVLQQEARILQQLTRLDRQLAEVKTQGAQTDGYKVTGTDLLWHGWESATRRQLNIELARLRSQKLSAMDDLRRAFGRKQAVADLSQRLHERPGRSPCSNES